jgi:hypothetical protein
MYRYENVVFYPSFPKIETLTKTTKRVERLAASKKKKKKKKNKKKQKKTVTLLFLPHHNPKFFTDSGI